MQNQLTAKILHTNAIVYKEHRFTDYQLLVTFTLLSRLRAQRSTLFLSQHNLSAGNREGLTGFIFLVDYI